MKYPTFISSLNVLQFVEKNNRIRIEGKRTPRTQMGHNKTASGEEEQHGIR